MNCLEKVLEKLDLDIDKKNYSAILSSLKRNFDDSNAFSERCEILGDSILNFFTVQYIYNNYQDLNLHTEGFISKLKSALVSRYSFCYYAKKISLAELIKNLNSTISLSDSFEALFGIFLDIGVDFSILKEKYYTLLKKHYDYLIASEENLDFKSFLQSYSQKYFHSLPEYIFTDADENNFVIYCSLNEFKAKGEGKSKKTAEQNAAKKILMLLDLDAQETIFFCNI